jgi:hypothetical protein
VLDFGAVQNGIPEAGRGRRIEVDSQGYDIEDSAIRDMINAWLVSKANGDGSLA